MIKASIESIRNIIRKNLIFILSVTSILFVFIIFFGKYLLQLLYGQIYYTNAYPILLILMLGNIFVAEAAVYGTYITASDNQKKKIPMQLEASLFSIAGLILLHRFGIYGAAVSYLAATVYLAIRYTSFTISFLNKKEKENKNGRTN